MLKLLKILNRFFGETKIFQKILNDYLKTRNEKMTDILTVINRQYTR